jgi:hypothetical protein
MTRSAFLFKLLAVVGIGQAATNHRLVSDGKGALHEECITTHGFPRPCEAMDGWEECPIGHYQKPRYIAMRSEDLLAEPADEEEYVSAESQQPGIVSAVYIPPQPYTIERINQHVCSVCGIVYVKQESK